MQYAVLFRWFLDDEEIRTRVEKEPEHFSTTMLSMYRASNLIFCGENELEDVKSFTRDLLKKSLLTKHNETQGRFLVYSVNYVHDHLLSQSFP